MSYNYHIQSDIPASTPIGDGLTMANVFSLLDSLANLFSVERLYRVRIIYEAGGLQFSNTLYYHASSPLADFMADAESIAFQIKQEVIPRIQDVLPQTWVVKELRVTGFNTVFDVIADDHVIYVGVPGSRGNQDTYKTGRPAYNIRFFLNSQGLVGTLGQSLKLLPRRGRVYIPAALNDIKAGEQVLESGWGGVTSHLRTLCNKLAENLENANPPVVYSPIRVKWIRVPIIGRFIATGFLPVRYVDFASEVTFLDKRQF